ncbi:MAG: hypothetical protein M3O50_08905 [Myxococcota bacterium]|nr:hypothetical protein [Myxococcota bacterium]
MTTPPAIGSRQHTCEAPHWAALVQDVTAPVHVAALATQLYVGMAPPPPARGVAQQNCPAEHGGLAAGPHGIVSGPASPLLVLVDPELPPSPAGEVLEPPHAAAIAMPNGTTKKRLEFFM